MIPGLPPGVRGQGLLLLRLDRPTGSGAMPRLAFVPAPTTRKDQAVITSGALTRWAMERCQSGASEPTVSRDLAYQAGTKPPEYRPTRARNDSVAAWMRAVLGRCAPSNQTDAARIDDRSKAGREGRFRVDLAARANPKVRPIDEGGNLTHRQDAAHGLFHVA